MNLANKITMSRLFMIPIFVFILETDIVPYSRQVAAAVFVIAALTDALDGYIARSRNMITNFGKLMDPLADKILVCAALIYLSALGDLSPVIVVLIISREFIITGLRLAASLNNVVLAAGGTGKIKTVCQMIMIVLLLADIGGTIFSVINEAFIWLSVIFTIVSAAEYISKNRSVFLDASEES